MTLRRLHVFVYSMLLYTIPVGALAADAAAVQAEILERLQRLESRQAEMEQQLKDKDARIKELEGQLQGKPVTETTIREPQPDTGAPPVPPAQQAAAPDTEKKPSRLNTHTPGRGTTIAETDSGDINFRLYAYSRYLNQNALDNTYTDAFGNTRRIDRRQDFQVNKMNLFFYGWLMDPRFHYLSYVWTSNASQGRGAQVVVAGNMQYDFTDWLTGGVGIGSLPGTRSTEGNFPFWLGVDNRLIGDEFFRPSYTTGIWASGKPARSLKYQLMLGNNLSQLGVDAGQLNNGLNTWSGMLSWMPGGEYGAAFGDFESHRQPVTRFGLHFTRSEEDRQSQPGTEDIENVQLRVSDGSIVFTPGLFGAGINITDATYQMAAFDAGLKYKGYSVEGEYYLRWIDDLRGPNTDMLPFNELNDHGFQLQTSAMLIPKRLQLYLSGSKVFGEYGNPWDARLGVNLFPWQNKVVRWNTELLYLDDSPVGALSLPYTVGASGPVFHTNLEVNY